MNAETVVRNTSQEEPEGVQRIDLAAEATSPADDTHVNVSLFDTLSFCDLTWDITDFPELFNQLP